MPSRVSENYDRVESRVTYYETDFGTSWCSRTEVPLNMKCPQELNFMTFFALVFRVYTPIQLFNK